MTDDAAAATKARRILIRGADVKRMALSARIKADSMTRASGVEQAITAAHIWLRAYPNDPVKRVFWRAVIVHLERKRKMNSESA